MHRVVSAACFRTGQALKSADALYNAPQKFRVLGFEKPGNGVFQSGPRKMREVWRCLERTSRGQNGGVSAWKIMMPAELKVGKERCLFFVKTRSCPSANHSHLPVSACLNPFRTSPKTLGPKTTTRCLAVFVFSTPTALQQSANAHLQPVVKKLAEFRLKVSRMPIGLVVVHAASRYLLTPVFSPASEWARQIRNDPLHEVTRRPKCGCDRQVLCPNIKPSVNSRRLSLADCLSLKLVYEILAVDGRADES